MHRCRKGTVQFGRDAVMSRRQGSVLIRIRPIAMWVVVGWLAVATPASAARPCGFPETFGPRSSSPDGPRHVRFLTDVRAGAHRCFDRATFEFRRSKASGLGYHVEYEPAPVREDGSGRPVAIRGRAYLVVRLSPARDTDLSSGRPKPTYRGPDAVEPRGGTRIVEVRHVSSFEGTVKWAVGVDRRRPFRVTTLMSPPRLVIDVG
jgi:hypothetical protein